MNNQVQLEPTWLRRLNSEFEQPYMKGLKTFLGEEKKKGFTLYPKGNEYFKAFELTPFDEVKVVIIGQDPYHGPGQAHGLCFSVRPDIKTPPSLVNIYKELNKDLDVEIPTHGNLEYWAKQGVLLLNAVLTVRKAQAASHRGKGWEEFTDRAIYKLANERENLCFVLWGSFAQKKGSFIDRSKHLVIESPHPSPLSAHRGFFGSKPFSKVNAYLIDKGKEPIDWQIPQVNT